MRDRRQLVEALLLALEFAEATTVGAEPTTAAATSSTASATSSTVAKATAAASTTTAEAATTSTATTSTAAAKATASTIVGTRSSVVDADSTALDILTVQSLESSSSLLGGGEVDVSETLERAGVAVGGKGDTSDAAVLGEDLLDGIVGAVKGQVAEEESVGGSAALVAVFVGASVLVRLLTRSAKVHVQLATIELILVHLLLSLGSVGGISKLDVTKALGAPRLAVSNDTAANDVAEALELAAEPVLINVPAQAANEQVLDTVSGGSGGVGLGFLDGRLSSGFSLALLGWSLLLLAVGVGRVGSGVRIGIGVVRRLRELVTW